MEKEKDIIDRHYKKRSILIDEELLYNPKTQDYIHEIIDINEISDYYDTYILYWEENEQKLCNHIQDWMLQTKVLVKYDKEALDRLTKNIKFILLLADHDDAINLKRFYKCETLIH